MAGKMLGFFNWLLGVAGDVANFLGDAFEAFFAALKHWLWFPLRDFLIGMLPILDLLEGYLEQGVRDAWEFLERLDAKIGRPIGWLVDRVEALWTRVDNIWLDFPGFLIDGIIRYFFFWAEPVWDLFTDFIDAHWDD